jgi:alanine racemase
MVFFSRVKKYRHLNKVLINGSALKKNYMRLKALHPEAKIAPVLKSNAYGHGLKVVAPVFDSFSPPFLIVDSLYEAYELKSLNLKTPILILGYTYPDNYLVKPLPFHFTVFDLESATALNRSQKNCQVHVFVDTGMNREGVPLPELDVLIKEIKRLKNLKVVGLASHFSDADNSKSIKVVNQQLERYKVALSVLENNGIFPKWKHISASGGAYKVKDSLLNMIRVGLAGYGINPLGEKDKCFNKLKLTPALSFVSTLVQVKTLNKGESVGYNCVFTAAKKMTVGVIPVGYYDGVDRRLSNNGIVLIGSKECSILGRVSMNIIVVDLSKVKEPKVGDEVVIISNSLGDSNNAVELATRCETIPYELLVHLAESLKREIVDDPVVIGTK